VNTIIGSESGLNTVTVIYIFLLLVGIIFDQAVSYMERHGYLRGYTALMVAVGVGFTVGSLAILSPVWALITLGAFIASGTPMMVGSIYRHVRDREQELERLRNEAKGE